MCVLYLNVDPALCRCFVELHVLVSEQMTYFIFVQLDCTTGPVCETLGVGVMGDTGGPEAVRCCTTARAGLHS